jgi:hypothetical protein
MLGRALEPAPDGLVDDLAVHVRDPPDRARVTAGALRGSEGSHPSASRPTTRIIRGP